MKRLTLIMLVAMVPFLSIAQKKGKKDKNETTTSNASYEFLVITGYAIMAPVSEDMSEELAGPNGAQVLAKINMSSNIESRILVAFDFGGNDSEENTSLSKNQYRSMSDAVNSAAKAGWEFVNANVVLDDKLKIHYYYMKRSK